MGSRAELAALTLLTAAGAGCYSTWDITPRGVVALDGFRQDQTRQIEVVGSGDSETVPFTVDTALLFRGNDGLESESHFRAIDVTNSVFSGVERDNGALINVDLSRMESVRARNFSVGKTVGLTLGLGVGVPAAVTGITIAVILATYSAGRPLRPSAGASPIRAPLSVDRRALGRRAMSPMISSAAGGDREARARLLAHWAIEASAECASIPAFVALARDLRRSSAPSALVRRALQAAREEARHTELCLTLANAYAPAPIQAWIPEAPACVDADLQSLLKRLALESFWDGCVAEGSAAAVAQRSVAAARDEATSAALRALARDEQGHAALSEDIVSYCLRAGGRPIRDALLESLEARRAAEEARIERGDEREGEEGGPADDDFLRARGLAPWDVRRAAAAEAWEKGVSTLARL